MPERKVTNPANPADTVGTVVDATDEDVETALSSAAPWDADVGTRADALRRAADLFETNYGALFAVLAREAGKTAADAIAEVREAVDFLRYYAARALEICDPARGVVTCISPWNFPLAIFTGQIAAALAAGNGVLAKPAETTTLSATLAVKLLHKAGVPPTSLQLLPGDGARVGTLLSSDPRIAGVCFTGSTQTAQRINRNMAAALSPDAPLIAETGGLNAMIVDSTALPEQAIKDIVASAFQSAGQRCSALRVLYLQEDIAEPFLEMLYGAMDELVVDDPWDLATDIGPLISDAAKADIDAHIDKARADGRLLKELHAPSAGHFIAPIVLQVNGIDDLEREVFGPVLHVATFRASDLDAVVNAINATGFGLTFGMHSRIDDRIEQVTARLNVGNIYINRNQIGAIVGSQPFGGEGLSGTGPKAGGPSYVRRFTQHATKCIALPDGKGAVPDQVQDALIGAAKPSEVPLRRQACPGPTGESNILSSYGRGICLCLGPTLEAATQQSEIARAHGCATIVIAPGAEGPNAVDGRLAPDALRTLSGFDIVVSWGPEVVLTELRRALAARDGALIPLVNASDFGERCLLERHVSIDTTAAGGNASLLAEAS
jgi:RHH-type proline utilization regulon transcriptional repressor/proline dehydrogenase/delta 1-pyrroline-5-carboxylate dehydrogenase